MARKSRGSRSGNGSNRVMTVRQAADSDGIRGERIERMIAAVKESQGFTRVLIRGIASFNTSTSGTVVYVNGTNVFNEQDFVNIAQEYNTYKISGMKFKIYDQAPTSAFSPTLFGTYHTANFGSAPNTYQQVADLVDCEEITPGGDTVTKYWYPSGPSENSYLAAGNENFGGLAIALPAVSSGVPRYSIVWAAVVDFRSRI